jgi:hypothetical protein
MWTIFSMLEIKTEKVKKYNTLAQLPLAIRMVMLLHVLVAFVRIVNNIKT